MKELIETETINFLLAQQNFLSVNEIVEKILKDEKIILTSMYVRRLLQKIESSKKYKLSRDHRQATRTHEQIYKLKKIN